MSGAHPSEGSASSPSSPSSSQNNTYFNYQAAVNNNAPKYSTLVPNRVFVGGIASNTTEEELCHLFSRYGNVTQAKIVVDRAGLSKGYGFITFDTEDEAKRLQKDRDNIMYKEKRLNIAPAFKKQGFPGTYDPIPTVTSPVPTPAPSMYYHNGITYHNGMAFFPSNGQQMVPATTPSVSSQETAAVYPQPSFAPPTAAPQSNQAAYGAPVMYANPAPMFVPTQPYQYSPMAFESFYQVAPNASYIYASPGPPLVGPPNSGPESIQYQLYPQPPPGDMFYTTAPMYPTTMLVNYDHTSYYPYSLDSTASSTAGLEVSNNTHYLEMMHPPQHIPQQPSNRSFQVQTNGAPRRINPRSTNKASTTSPTNNRNVIILTKPQTPSPPQDGSGDYPSASSTPPDSNDLCYNFDTLYL